MPDGEEKVSIRVATPGDLEGVLAVQRRSPGRASGPDFREHTARAIHDPARLFVVAVTADATVGWATTKHFDEADGLAPAGHYLMGITVTPEFRRHGVATKLVRARLEWIHRRDDQAYYFTSSLNEASVALHAGSGFCELSRAPRYRGVTFASGMGILFSLDLNKLHPRADAQRERMIRLPDAASGDPQRARKATATQANQPMKPR